MPKGPPRNVLDYAVAKGGIRKGMRVGTFIAQWTIAQDALGFEPTAEQAAQWWKESVATWYRRLEDFRSIFGPELSTPGPIAVQAIAAGEAHAEKVGEVMSRLGRIVPPGARPVSA